MHSTFIISGNSIKGIEFVFIEHGENYGGYIRDILKTDDICNLDRRLKNKGIWLRLHG